MRCSPVHRRAPQRALPAHPTEATAVILIGQYDSPFVRRVAIALRLYGLSYEHRPWSVFGNADEVARYN
ncbi:glutathione S-transferase N-terminal domain-containing protein, partial [Stenotrophomonas maltophilia]|uniref:glutathione S-transferase N-terminal domain-containing protein n=1 Tax=Stenotrophomonas maltophilia TaxID=40324 RepID=UPI001952AF15